MHVQERLQDSLAELGRHGVGLPAPVWACPQASELLQDLPALVIHPLVHLIHKFLAACIGLLVS